MRERQRAALRLFCGCGEPWSKHGRHGCTLKSCGCRLRLLVVDKNPQRGTVRVTFEMPLKQYRPEES